MIRNLVNKIGNVLPRIRSYYVYEVKNHVNNIESYPIIFKEVTNDNVRDAILFRDENVVNKFELFLSNGEFGLYGYYQVKVIVHGWVIMNKSFKNKLVNNYFLLPSKAAYIHFCNVNPKYRGKKVYQALLLELYRRLELAEYSIYIDTNDWNMVAQKAIEHTGAKFIYCLKTIWIFEKCVMKFVYKDE